MSTVCAEIRDLAQQLKPKLNAETIINIQSKLLALADQLEKQKPENITQNLRDNDIDDLLNEIDAKENTKTSNTQTQDEQKKLWIKWIENGLVFGVNYKQPPFMRRGLSKTIWKELLINLKLSNDKTEGFNRIYDQMPKEYYREFPGFSNIEGDYNQDNFSDLATWFVTYKMDKNNINDSLFNDIFDRIKNFGFWSEFRNKVCWSGIEEIVKYFQQFEKYFDINDQCMIDGMTLLHKTAEWGKSPVTDWLLSFKNIEIDTRDDEGKTALDIAKEKGHWNIVSTLTFACMGDKMREKTDTQIAKLNRMDGMIAQWFRFYKCDNIKSNEYLSMVKMCESIKNLIKERLPISDDLLMLCLHFELKQNNNNPLQCSIWKTLYNILNKCLRIPLNRRNWLWFKQYIFDSSIWFQKVASADDQKEETTGTGEPKLLYDLLIDMVSKQLKAQRDYLEPYINKLENDENKQDNQSWNDLKNYPQFIVTDNPQGLRQDECVEKGTGVELLSYPIRPIFNDDQLRKLGEKVKEFKPHHHFDVHGYLSKLVLVAHSLNDTFHKTMRYIFNVDSLSDTNFKHGLVYSEGPVKRLARSQAKAETDYASASYPTTAKIIDFIRCCCIYDKPSNLLKGIQKFMDAVNRNNMIIVCNHSKCGEKLEKLAFSAVFKHGESFICNDCRKRITQQQDNNIFVYHCPKGNKSPHVFGFNICEKCSEFRLNPPLKRVLRVKNMMLENKRENNGKWNLYQYADIKMGVLMEYEGQSMIVEVQFLVNFMLKAKGLGHGLYEIERNKDFIYDVDKIMQLGGSDNNIGASLRDAVVTNNENELATLILNYAPLDLTKLDDNNQSLINLACEKGNKKTLKFILATVEVDGTSSDLKILLNRRRDNENDTNDYTKIQAPIHVVIDKQYPNLLNILLKYDELNIHALDHRKRTPLFKMVTDTSIKYGKIAKMWNALKNDKRTKKEWNNIDEDGNTLFINVCGYEEDINFVKILWQSGLYKINDVNSRGQTALIKAATNGRTEIVKYLITNIVEIDLNICQLSMSAIDMAICNRHGDVIKLLYNDKRLNWKAGKRNKFTLSIESGDLDIIKLILKLWPQIDVNAPDIGGGNQSAVQAAAAHNEEILKYVLSIPNIKVDLVDGQGFTPWLTAISRQRLKCAQILWKRKDIDFYRKRDGKNALQWAQQFSRKQVIQWLKSIGF